MAATDDLLLHCQPTGCWLIPFPRYSYSWNVC